MATTFTNQATLSYNGSTVQSNVATGVIESAVSVSKQAVEETYGAGGVVTYIISIVNSGAADAAGLTVTDDLGGYAFGETTLRPLSFREGTLQYYSDGVLQPDPAAEVTEADGLVISGITVPAGGNSTLVYSADVNEFAPLEAGSAITNSVTVAGGGICAVSAEDVVNAESSAQLSLFKSVTPVPVAENGELTYTFMMQNSGSAPVTADDGAVISDAFAPTLSDIKVSLDGRQLEVDTDYTYDEDTGVFGTADGVITVPAATYAQDPDTGEISMTPGTAALSVTGKIGAFCGNNTP